MQRIEIEFSDAELLKLSVLAAYRTKQSAKSRGKDRNKQWSVADVVRAFAATCQPGGSGWKSPADQAMHDEA